jgi:hypothetical protein
MDRRECAPLLLIAYMLVAEAAPGQRCATAPLAAVHESGIGTASTAWNTAFLLGNMSEAGWMVDPRDGASLRPVTICLL